MKKIVVVGSGGAGKSTFSQQLGEKLNIPVTHLDQLYWRPNWTKTPDDEWQKIVRRELESESWIMDGNFGGTREMRMRASDAIIFLDMPRYRCMYRILKRMIRYHGRRRPDMAEGCYERFDWDFLKWVWNYPKRSKSRLLNEIGRFPDMKIIVLRTKNEIRDFLDNLRKA